MKSHRCDRRDSSTNSDYNASHHDRATRNSNRPCRCVVCARHAHLRECTARTLHALISHRCDMAVILLIRGCVANNVMESLKRGDADFLVQKQIPTSHIRDINHGTSILAQITTSPILILWSRNQSQPRIYLLSRNNHGVSTLAQNTTLAVLIIYWRSSAVFLKSWVFWTES